MFGQIRHLKVSPCAVRNCIDFLKKSVFWSFIREQLIDYQISQLHPVLKSAHFQIKCSNWTHRSFWNLLFSEWNILTSYFSDLRCSVGPMWGWLYVNSVWVRRVAGCMYLCMYGNYSMLVHYIYIYIYIYMLVV